MYLSTLVHLIKPRFNGQTAAGVIGETPPWPTLGESSEMMAAFENFFKGPDGMPLGTAYLVKVGTLLVQLSVRLPRLADPVASIASMIGQILKVRYIALQGAGSQQPQEIRNLFLRQVSDAYKFFDDASNRLDLLVSKHIKDISADTAMYYIIALFELYQLCLASNPTFRAEEIREHRETHRPIADRDVPEALSYHWRLMRLRRLILSSQMQQRVSAAVNMAQDLVNIWKKHKDTDDRAFMKYITDILLSTGLVAYILGPTCHPEITSQSGNIIGFLLVSDSYTREHTDLLWQTVTSTQDPRVSEALVRLVKQTLVSLYNYPHLVHLCQKLNTVAIEAFTPSMRELCDEVFSRLEMKFLDAVLPGAQEPNYLDVTFYMLCIRLIRESSVFGSRSPIAHRDVLGFAVARFKDLLGNGLRLSPGDRWEIHADCLQDIDARSRTSCGSLCVLSLMLRNGREMQTLASQHDVARILISELESAIPKARAAGFPTVLHGSHNDHRKNLLGTMIIYLPDSITGDLGPRLWNSLVGPGAACREDRNAGWQTINYCFKNSNAPNPFLQACSTEYLSRLPSECLCPGALQFVRALLTPMLNDETSIVLDEEDGVGKAEIEQLWRMVLTAPSGTIEGDAIDILVNDVYMESRSIKAFPPHRARKVHLIVVNRCLRQLSSAAAQLRAFSNGTQSGSDEESMVLVASDQEVHAQELLFIRSLMVLRQIHRLCKMKAQFSIPDLATLILDTSKDMQGEPAELKYQAFDGDEDTCIRSLEIGKLNTLGTLLSMLQEATGFPNFRLYFRGSSLLALERDVDRPLADLKIYNGLLLVKREDHVPTSSPNLCRGRPGISPLEAEILAHFEDLWSFLDMDVKLSQEIYQFLVELPIEEQMLRLMESPTVTYHDIFPPGQAFRALYGIFALEEYVSKARARANRPTPDEQTAGQRGLHQALSLVVPALSEREVVGQCSQPDLQVKLGSRFVQVLLDVVRDPLLPSYACGLLDGSLLNSLLRMAHEADSVLGHDLYRGDELIDQTLICFRAIVQCCTRSPVFWAAFRKHPETPTLMAGLLLNDSVKIRTETSLVLSEKFLDQGDNMDSEFLSFFWPLLSGLLQPEVLRTHVSTHLLLVCFGMLKVLWKLRPSFFDASGFMSQMSHLLVSYTTYEDITRPELVDPVAQHLVGLVHYMVGSDEYAKIRDEHVLSRPGYARQLFWKHLFPEWEALDKAQMPRVILHPDTRRLLVEVISRLIGEDIVQLQHLVDDLDSLVPNYAEEAEGEWPLCPGISRLCLTWNDEGDPYSYDLPMNFDRTKALRAPCGYVGLKNLSNTCYFNSLFTQLFMNLGFRQFLFDAAVQPDDESQTLLFETQKLFALMQHSLKRFVSPEDCIGSIKTYDPEHPVIDVHNQMDVDEFYNLLFDRWEGQLHSTEAKQQFRSFYGGQLVSQIASKECKHVSERHEPFSAIQCDIKGKSSLEESLQAYVEGEVMEGDNKYKCSTCDRHVDAVKRSCLKDVPDHLIFHLKRFDYDLRNFMRRKINDHFAFPHTIDMRPYTQEALNKKDKAERDESSDVFELVGVLVHTGTAESGHYYSYVRERPTEPAAFPSWLEFNDDIVSKWDPRETEDACFGGQEFVRQSGHYYDKPYSAYMLFYQRSSNLQKMQEAVTRDGCKPPLPRMATALAEGVEQENIAILRRHCLYDVSHISLVNWALSLVKECHPNGSVHPPEFGNEALTMALSHLDQVASRAKDTPDFISLVQQIKSLTDSCDQCNVNLFYHFDSHQTPMRTLLQRNPSDRVRQTTGQMILDAVRRIKEQSPEQYCPADYWKSPDNERRSVLHGMMRIFQVLFEHFHASVRSWPEVFDFMLVFVKMGPVELASFLRRDFLKKLLLIVQADSGMDSLEPQFLRMLQAVSRRMATRQAQYHHIIELISTLLPHLAVPPEEGGLLYVDNPEHRLTFMDHVDADELATTLYPLTEDEHRVLSQEWPSSADTTVIFLEKLISLNQNLGGTRSIVRSYMGLGPQYERKVFRTLKENITGELGTEQFPSIDAAPFLRIAAEVFCPYAESAGLIRGLKKHVNKECFGVQSTEGRAFLQFQQQLFDGPREKSGESPRDILEQGLDDLENWVPSLLSYYDTRVAQELQLWLHDRFFEPIVPPGCIVPEEVVAQAMQKLGTACLRYLENNFVMQQNSLSSSLLQGFETVIEGCSRYFDVEGVDSDQTMEEFFSMQTGMYAPDFMPPTSPIEAILN
jgi:ubiquitin carboxyl-terminal hydrolase 34